MSFPAFRYQGPGSVLEEEWDSNDEELAPDIQILLEENRFLFVVFRNIDGTITFEKALFWSMPVSDIESCVKPVWDATRRAIRAGRMDDLPKAGFNSVCHVRPHARNKRDTLPTPHNGPQVKKSFWLDRDYITKQIGTSDD